LDNQCIDAEATHNQLDFHSYTCGNPPIEEPWFRDIKFWKTYIDLKNDGQPGDSDEPNVDSGICHHCPDTCFEQKCRWHKWNLKENRYNYGGRPICQQCNLDTSLPKLIYDDADPDKTHEKRRYQLICEPRFKYAMGGNRNKLLGDHVHTFFPGTMPLMSHPDSNFKQLHFQKRSLHGWFKIQCGKKAGPPRQMVGTKGTIARITSKIPYYIGDDNADPGQTQMLLGYEYIKYEAVKTFKLTIEFFVIFSNYDGFVDQDVKYTLGRININNYRYKTTGQRHQQPNWGFF